MTDSPGLRRLALAACVLAWLALAGCRQELYSGLPEEEANLMLAALLENGLSADKAARGKSGFVIFVDKDDLVRSLNLLKSYGLPRDKFQNLGQVFSGQGMIASPTEEQARLAFGTSQELAETFSRIDGVLTARTHVVLARHDAATGQSTPASAAVFIRHAPDSPVTDLAGKIREICAQAVPGLDYERVSVMLVPVRGSLVWPEGRSQEEKGWLGRDRLFWLVFFSLPVLAAAVGFLIRFRRRAVSKPG
ncbi:MAG: type III secretion inner membrane ring lipoprotein SctJ [Candidatus Adiutrix sp.]|jgi:type III secretion protein J|nr:type III secretion inner membrane ring lipoprotein SctJ [Candidatus Adiutrix sp.]